LGNTNLYSVRPEPVEGLTANAGINQCFLNRIRGRILLQKRGQGKRGGSTGRLGTVFVPTYLGQTISQRREDRKEIICFSLAIFASLRDFKYIY